MTKGARTRRKKDQRASPATAGTRRRQPPVKPALFWASMALTGICVAAIVWLVFGGVPVRDFGIWPRVLVLALLALFAVASLASTEVIPWGSRSWAEWRRPKVLGTIVYLLLGAAGFIAGVANIFNPPLADQATQLAIRNEVGEIGNDTDVLIAGQGNIAEAMGIGRISLVRENIRGVWGEAGCAVTYRFGLNDRSLVMSSLRDEPGMAPFREEYTILADTDRAGPSGERLSIMDTTEVGGAHDGQSVTFTYGGNGSSAWLEWKHRSQGINAQRLVRCHEFEDLSRRSRFTLVSR